MKNIYADWLSGNMASVIVDEYNNPWGIYERIKKGNKELTDEVLGKVLKLPSWKGVKLEDIYNDPSALRVAIDIMDIDLEKWIRFKEYKKRQA